MDPSIWTRFERPLGMHTCAEHTCSQLTYCTSTGTIWELAHQTQILQGGQTPALNKDRQWNRFSVPAGPLAAHLDHQQTSILISIANTLVTPAIRVNAHACVAMITCTHFHLSLACNAQ